MLAAILRELKRGIISENPVFVVALGLCPALAVTTTLKNAFGMGLAAAFVLICSNTFISLIRNAIPQKIRIPASLMVIAFFVSVVQLYMRAYFSDLNFQLGIYVPLIAVNCIILSRAEIYAFRSNVFYSFLDGVCVGLGFMVALILLSGLRELSGANQLWGFVVIPKFQPAVVMQLAPGGFFTLAFILVIRNFLRNRKKARKP
jgi:electron transport complex protein RnfE